MIDVQKNTTGQTIFYLTTKTVSLVLLVTESGIVLTPYWGGRITSQDISYVTGEITRASYLADADGQKDFKLEQLPQIYPAYGYTDLRGPAFAFLYADGSRTTDLRYASHRTYSGKEKLDGLPALRPSQDCQTLELRLADPVQSMEAVLRFSVFESHDAITESVRVANQHKTQSVRMEKLCSANIDLMDCGFDLLHLSGAWGRECHIRRRPLEQGTQSVSSARGASGHGHNPFAALVTPDTDEVHGEVYALHLVYSGNFTVSAEVDMHQNTRFQIGINPFDFSWLLEPGQSFQSPEAVLVYSGEGLGRMSQIFHHMYQDLLIPERFAKQERPVLLNSWEAHYFDFDGTALTALAAEAADIGAELFVLDDGWFGKRSDTTSSVGDWTPNEEKLGGSLQELTAAIEETGLAFGLWFEPEMVSPDSYLYRRHPEWVIQAAGRRIEKSRDEYVLGLSNPAVCEHIITSVGNILSQNNIRYVKWDMNRNLTNLGSTYLPAERQQEQAHRYILGLYRVLDTLTHQFPDVLFEGCAGGGGRFDPGILYYMPQMWPSDDTDAVERLAIQYGVSLLYPPSVMERHISAAPNHQVARREPLETRAAVAMWGNLGLELNLVRMDKAEKAALAEEIAFYKKVRPLVQFGDLYRLKGLDGGNQYAWMFQSQDQKTVLVSFVQIQASPNTVSKRLRLRHLDPDAWYRIEGSGAVRSGREMMHIGLDTGKIRTDAYSRRWLLTRMDRASC